MNLKKLLGAFFAFLLVANVSAAEAEENAMVAEETDEGFSCEIAIDLMSDYMWRGTIFNDNPVIQPWVWMGYSTEDFGTFSGYVWGSFDMTRKRGTYTNSRRACGWGEMDYVLSYEISLADLKFEVGHMWFTYPNNNGSTDQEVYGVVKYENPIVTPSASVYWNYSDSDGNKPSCLYYSFGLEREFEIGDQFVLIPNASLGFGGNAWNRFVTDEKGLGTQLTDQTVGIAAKYKITENLTFGAQWNFTWTPSHTLRHNDYMGNDKDMITWGGVSVTLAF